MNDVPLLSCVCCVICRVASQPRLILRPIWVRFGYGIVGRAWWPTTTTASAPTRPMMMSRPSDTHGSTMTSFVFVHLLALAAAVGSHRRLGHRDSRSERAKERERKAMVRETESESPPLKVVAFPSMLVNRQLALCLCLCVCV